MSAYVSPFDHATQGRVDQGVDYTGSGVIRAIGNAQIIRIGAPGWPGGPGPSGQGILYKLLDGPNAGQYVYVYEGIRVTPYRPGQIVATGTPLGTFYPGGSVEIGFADANGVPLSHSTYHEGAVTTWGGKMKSFLASLAPAGSSITHPTVGSIATNVPQALGNAAGGVLNFVGEQAMNLALAAIKLIWGAIGADASRILLTIALVIGGGFLVFTGTTRALGAGEAAA